MMNTANSKIEQIRTLLSKIMMYGAIAIVVLGLALHIFKSSASDLSSFSDKYAFNVEQFATQLSSGDSYGILMLGILILMFIPVMRVLLYIVEFAMKKNRLYFGISLLILTVLMISIVLG